MALHTHTLLLEKITYISIQRLDLDGNAKVLKHTIKPAGVDTAKTLASLVGKEIEGAGVGQQASKEFATL